MPRLTDTARGLPRGTRYVMCVLRPSRDLSLDTEELTRALESLTGDRAVGIPAGDYLAVGGTRRATRRCS